jgi:hypothetical protein
MIFGKPQLSHSTTRQAVASRLQVSGYIDIPKWELMTRVPAE